MRKCKKSLDGLGTMVGCLPIILLVAFNVFIGGKSVGYILSWFSINIPTWGDMVIGLFVAEFSVPIAIIGWILRICGVF